MTVKELIAALSLLDEDLEVFISPVISSVEVSCLFVEEEENRVYLD